MKFFGFAGNFEIKTLSLLGDVNQSFENASTTREVWVQTNAAVLSDSPELPLLSAGGFASPYDLGKHLPSLTLTSIFFSEKL